MEKRWCDEEEEDVSLLLHKQGCLIQILVWLPVESLLRFNAVCKSWRDLIQSPFFIDLHTPIILNSPSSKFGSFIVQVYKYFTPPDEESPSNEYTLLMLSSPSDYSESEESVSISGGGGDQEEGPGPVPVPVVDDLGFDMKSKRIVGTCNGLVCLRGDRNAGPKPLLEVSLWNPATGKGVDLPESIPIPGAMSNLFLFGFDVETKDYKVVRLTSLKPRWNGNLSGFCFCRVQVYCLSTDSWRLLEGIPCLPGYPFDYTDSIVYLNNGTCFFLAHHFYTRRYPCLPENDRFIISFDFTKEIITPIQLPDHHRDQDLCLCSLGDDKIALLTSTNLRDRFEGDAPIRLCEDFNIWVLNYERSGSSRSVNKKSWRKLYLFQRKSRYEWYKPSGISNDGKFALLEYGNKMNLYNFATSEVKRDFLSCRKVMSKAHAYKPSLVSVIGGNGAGELVQGAAAADMVIENSATNGPTYEPSCALSNYYY